MDQDIRESLTEAVASRSPEALEKAVTALLRAGQRRDAGWALHAGLLAGVPASGSSLDALAPSLESYVADPIREYPRKDLTPAQVAWLPDGRLAVGSHNAHVIDALDLETGAHQPIYQGSERAEREYETLPRSLNWFVVDGDQIYIGSEEDLPTGGNATTLTHWYVRSLDPTQADVEHLGMHADRVLASRHGSELLGLASGSALHAWKPGDPITQEGALVGTSVRVAPGTCVRRMGEELLSFHSPDGREQLAEVPFPGTITQRWDGVQAAWGGRAQVRDASKHALLLLDPSGELQRTELPESIPAETWWAHYPHPSGLLAGLRVSRSESFHVMDLRSGAVREFPLPKYTSPGEAQWSPCGAVAIPLREGVLVIRPSA